MSKPLFVAISDIHFSVPNLELASKSLRAALNKAEELNIPLVIAGDLNDTKAIIRAEVANAIISILRPSKVTVYILEGNHDKVNEKGSEHGLNYLRPYAEIIDKETYIRNLHTTFIPYTTDLEKLKVRLNSLPSGKFGVKLLMHQGFYGAFMGDYIQDKSSISTDIVKDYIVISGHYHRHQTLDTVTYIGSPYTITYGEANDGPKGFLIVNEDGTFTREILNLRKHIIVEREIDANMMSPVTNYSQGDLVKVRLKGPRNLLNKVNKNELGMKLIGHSDYRLELIIEEQSTSTVKFQTNLTDHELMLQLIEDRAPNLKKLYLEVLDEAQEGSYR